MRGAVAVIAAVMAACPPAGFAQGNAGDFSGRLSGNGGNAQLGIRQAPVQDEIALSCRFGIECLEAEGCVAGGLSATLDGRAGGMDAQSMTVQAELAFEAGAVEMLGVMDSGAMSLSGGPFEARHLLTRAPDGATRYTVHYTDGPMVVSYLGQCEARQ